MWIIKILGFNLLIVFLTELPLAYLLGAKNVKKLVTTALINIVTNPAVVLTGLCISMFFSRWKMPGTFILEALVFITEGFMFSRFDIFEKKNPYLISLVLNFTSFLLGELINLF